ncbi:MAG: amidohydrolase family protein [Bacillota bacterium]|nr:amidohydrolase family protein [Bacillota bacterium]
MKTIDVHNHFYPMTYLRDLYRNPGVARLDGDPDGPGDVKLHYEGDYNVLVCGHRRLASRLADMDAAGVDVHVLTLTTPGVHVEAPQRELGLARMVNDDFAAIVREHAGRFQAFAALPLGQPGAAAAREFERACTELGLAGGLVFSNVNGVYPDDERFWDLYERADALRKPIFIHPTTPAHPQAFLDYRMVAVAGFLFDTTLAIGRIAFSGLLERFPNLTFILAHLGATAPYIAERMDRAFAVYPECRERISTPPSELIKSHCYLDSVNFDPDALRLGLAFAGPRRVMLGSDYPHQVGDMPRAVRAIKEHVADETVRAAVLGGNAGALLRL